MDPKTGRYGEVDEAKQAAKQAAKWKLDKQLNETGGYGEANEANQAAEWPRRAPAPAVRS